MTDPLPTPPDVLRAASAELVVTDLARARHFYVDVLGLLVTEEDDEAVYLRAFEEYLHHSLVLRRGPVAAVARLSYRVRAEQDLDRAQQWFTALACPVQRVPAGTTAGVGESVRVRDPLGFPLEFFAAAGHVERFTRRYDRFGTGALARLDHFNVVVPDVAAAQRFHEQLGFRVTEDIRDDEGTVYAAWLRRKPTVHDVALTGGDGPRLHHVAFLNQERTQILNLCDTLGALRLSDHIERGPGRHGVSNAFYLYLRDPDGHRVELYSQDYYTGGPGQPGRELGRARQPAAGLVGQPGGAVLVHRRLDRARPRRRPGPAGGAERDPGGGRHDRRGRVLLHPHPCLTGAQTVVSTTGVP